MSVNNACAFLNQQFERLRGDEPPWAAAVTSTTKTRLYFGVHQRYGLRQAWVHDRRVPSDRHRQPDRWGAGRLEAGCEMRGSRAAEPGRSLHAVPVLPHPGRGSGGRVNKGPPLPTLRCWATAGKRHSQAAGDRRGLPDPGPASPSRTASHSSSLYVLGMPLCDNVSARWPADLLESAKQLARPTCALTSFMQDFRIHFRHSDGRSGTVPVLRPSTRPISRDVFSRQSCLSLFRLRQCRSRSGRWDMGCHFRPPMGWW